ncbi:MAG: serine hydrolase domain-containing protein [Hyphomicrobiaceae bacterium]
MTPSDIMSGAPVPKDNQVTLANWRVAPYNRWAFHHVREIIPTAEITARPSPVLTRDLHDIWDIPLEDDTAQERTFGNIMEQTHTSGLVVLRSGRVVAEWFDDGYDRRLPHILFSVSKSITSVLTGILADRDVVEPDAPVARYIPEVEGSAYGDCTIRHVLDMTVSTSFEEVYLDPDGEFARYRAATGWNPSNGTGQGDLRSFLLTLKSGTDAHGERFHYLSPNSDLLGWILERASGRRFADLLSEHLWQPMGAEAAASITVDRLGAPRTAGGISARPHDLARIGELMRKHGVAGDEQVVPAWWIDDITGYSDNAAWLRGDLAHLFPEGGYRSKWYQTGKASGAFCSIGIHGQWLYVDPSAEVVIARTAAQPEPVDEALDLLHITAFEAVSKYLTTREV